MSNENKEFYDLLDQIVNEQTFDLELTNGSLVKCRQLSTAQLKELIETVVDSPITQSVFVAASNKAFQQSLILPDPFSYTLTVVDKLLFLLETRINSISEEMVISLEDEQLTVNFKQVKEKLKETIKQNLTGFSDQEVTEGEVTLTVGIPTLNSENQLNDEIYKHLVINTDDLDELRKALGKTFIHELAKSIKLIKIKDKVLDLSTVSFQSRLDTIEKLPASCIYKVVDYVEKYKRLVEQALTIKDYTVPVDGSLFSIR